MVSERSNIIHQTLIVYYIFMISKTALNISSINHNIFGTEWLKIDLCFEDQRSG